MDELKNCPFCGRKMKLTTSRELGLVEFQLISHADYAQMVCPLGRGVRWAGTAEEATYLWNMRAECEES